MAEDAKTVEEAKKLVQEDLNKKLEACKSELEAVLAKHGMQLHVATPAVTIVPKP